jgi:hypothetical protein
MESLRFSANIYRRDVWQDNWEGGGSFNPCSRNSATARTNDHVNDDHDKTIDEKYIEELTRLRSVKYDLFDHRNMTNCSRNYCQNNKNANVCSKFLLLHFIKYSPYRENFQTQVCDLSEVHILCYATILSEREREPRKDGTTFYVIIDVKFDR